MSNYYDKELFLEPKTTQYGSHMVMTNVVKSLKKKYINIDTRFRDEYNTNQIVNYNITLAQKINEVKTITVTNIEIPMTIYNISSSIGNNSFKLTRKNTSNSFVVDLSDGNYDSTTLINSINSKINSSIFTGDISLNIINNKCYFNSTTYDYLIDFAVDNNGNFDKYSIRSKLGWVLGFREIQYTSIHGIKTYSESMIDLNGSRYLYLAIDEFSGGSQTSFVSPLSKSVINKNILARISLDNHDFPFGTIFSANRMNGTLISDIRSYNGKNDIQKINVQLLNEYGIPVNLNGMDISFSLELEHE